jgi:uncharacterized membrane protein
MSSNPYATPKAAVADEPVPHGELVPGGKGVPASNGWSWLADGWTMFKAAPGLWIGIMVVLVVILFAMAMVPFLGPVAQNLLMPVFMGGIALGCRAIDDGTGLEFSHLFEGFKTRFGTLVAVGALYLAGFVAVLVVVMLIFGAGMAAMFIGGGQQQPDMAQAGAVIGVLLAVLVAIALSLPLVMAIWFAPALVVFHDLGAVEAMKQSFSGCLRNIVPFLVYGVIGLVLAIVATIPLGLGWLVLGPVIAASVYTAYRDIYLR